MSRTRFWTLTLHNPSEDDISSWCTAVEDGRASYLCFQQENAPTTGILHLQGYVVFVKTIRLAGVKKALRSTTVHAVRSNGSPSSNRTYCSKEEGSVPNSFKEFGQIPDDPVSGKRSDLEAFKEAVANGLRDHAAARIDFPEVVAKYPRWCYDIIADQDDIQHDLHELYEWQSDLKATLELPADDRKIIFVVDKPGNHGKTWFAKQYVKMHSDAQYMEPGKKADMAYALKSHIRVLFLNVTRSVASDQMDYLYSFIESVKDGMVFSPKYESHTKYLGKVHVVVMMNQEPNMILLSSDRYVMIELK